MRESPPRDGLSISPRVDGAGPAPQLAGNLLCSSSSMKESDRSYASRARRLTALYNGSSFGKQWSEEFVKGELDESRRSS